MNDLPDSLLRETEFTLRVRARDRRATLRRLIDLTRMDGYRLETRPGIEVRDQYMDTPERRLSDAGLALRLRKYNNQTLITLKGPPTSNPDGSKTRLELEHELSPQAMVAIAGIFKSFGILLPNLATAPFPGQGLEIIQDRVTTRSIRMVYLPKQDAPLAELVIDEVVYRPHGEPIHHAELEIELSSGGEPQDLSALCQQLLLEFEDRLTLWHQGKLAIGEAILRLTTPREPESFLDDDRGLTEEAYEAIRKFLG